MPYTHTSIAGLLTQLARRLNNPVPYTFWGEEEMLFLLHETMRTFAALTGFWRTRAVFSTVAGTAFYDITSTSGPSAFLARTLRDQTLVKVIQGHLLEPITGSSWTGTEMYTLAEVTAALQRRRDQFLADTGCAVTRTTGLVGPSFGRFDLNNVSVDVRRVIWQEANSGVAHQLWPEDESSLSAYDANWAVNSSQPYAYSVLGPPPLTVQLAPAPVSAGALDVITVDAGAALDPATGSGVLLGVPDDLAWGVKWGTLCDLLAKDGPARDPVRSAYCESRYQQAVQIAKIQPVVLSAAAGGVRHTPDALQAMDAVAPGWQAHGRGAPTRVLIAGPNLVAVHPVPNGIYSIELDIVRQAPVPTNLGDNLQVGREQLDAWIDYAEHLALFKCAGAEWQATAGAPDKFLTQAMRYNERLAAVSPLSEEAGSTTPKEAHRRPREKAGAVGVMGG